jgi:hypothetical protein
MDFDGKDIRLPWGLKLPLPDQMRQTERGCRKTIAAAILGRRLVPKMSGLFQD